MPVQRATGPRLLFEFGAAPSQRVQIFLLQRRRLTQHAVARRELPQRMGIDLSASLHPGPTFLMHGAGQRVQLLDRQAL